MTQLVRVWAGFEPSVSASIAFAALTTALLASVLDPAWGDPGSALSELPVWQESVYILPVYQAEWGEGDVRAGLRE